MPDQVDDQTKKQRAEKLAKLGNKAMARFASLQIGKTLEVLVETAAPIERVSGEGSPETTGTTGGSGVSGTCSRNYASIPKHLTGLADNYVSVCFEGESSLKGKIVSVKIARVDENCCAVGEISFET